MYPLPVRGKFIGSKSVSEHPLRECLISFQVTYHWSKATNAAYRIRTDNMYANKCEPNWWRRLV
jgi:hypothetical protein